MKFVRRKISVESIDPPNTRYDETCDCVQTRASDTSPWVQDDAADPRHGTRYLLPPRTGGTARCDAAENMMQHFKAQVDAFLTAATILQFVNAVLTLAAIFIPALGILAKLIFVIADALLTIGASVIDAAMTAEVYDQIKCIIYDNIGEDGQMSAAQLADIQTAIDTQIGGTPNLVFDLFTGLWGEVGWSNAGAVGEFVGDCDDCGWCVLYDFTIEEYGFAPLSGTGQYVAGVGWQTTLVDEGSGVYNARDIAIARDFEGLVITQVVAGFIDATPGSFVGAPPDAWIGGLYNDAALLDDIVEPIGDFTLSLDGDITLGVLQAFMRMGYALIPDDPGGQVTMTYVRLMGIGTPPADGVPC